MKFDVKEIIGCYRKLIYKSIRRDREKQIIECLSCEKDAGFNIRKVEYRKTYQKIKKQYTEIRVHKLWSTRIGEYIVRYLRAVEDSEVNVKSGILDLFVLSDCVNHNTRLSKIMGRNIHIVDETNVDIWMYILTHFPKVELIKYWNTYSIKRNDRLRNSIDTAQYFKLTESEEGEGQYKKKLMELQREFVCALSRDATYLATILPALDCSYHDYRDSDINKTKRAADYLLKKGIPMVRMGRYVLHKANFNNCIDYANQYYDELMDIVLMRDCKFFIGDPNGLALLPMVMNRPVALKNWVPVFSNAESFPYNPHNLYIFKKYYLISENRFLTIKEMMQIDKKIKRGKYDGHLYEKYGIEVVENSEEEILDLVMEMNSRIDGEWIETAEEIELQEKYKTIYREWCRQQNYKESEIINFNIGIMFLKKNLFLLEDERR